MITELLMGGFFSLFAFIAYRVYKIETNHLKHMEMDIALIKKDVNTILNKLEKM